MARVALVIRPIKFVLNDQQFGLNAERARSVQCLRDAAPEWKVTRDIVPVETPKVLATSSAKRELPSLSSSCGFTSTAADPDLMAAIAAPSAAPDEAQ